MHIKRRILNARVLGGVLVLGMGAGFGTVAHAQYDNSTNLMGSNRYTGGPTQGDYDAMAQIQAEIAAQRAEAAREAAEERAAQQARDAQGNSQ